MDKYKFNAVRAEIVARIKQHKQSGYCMSYKEAGREFAKDSNFATDKFYDVGVFETLVSILNFIDKLNTEKGENK